MAKLLIKNRQLEQDRWTLVRDAEAGVPDAPVIVPLAYWKQQRDSRAGADFGVWLAPADDPAELADAIADSGRVVLPVAQDPGGQPVGLVVLEGLDMVVDLDGKNPRLTRNIAPNHQHNTKLANGVTKAQHGCRQDATPG